MLFGNQQQQSGGLFGQPQQPQQQSTGNQAQGLFGQSQQNQPQQSSLFGQTSTFSLNQPQPQSGGLFGQQSQQPQQQQSSLFGQQSSSLFGTGQTTQQTGGLFGQQPSQTGGLFGTVGAQQGGMGQTGMGQPGLGQTQQQTGGLFGQQTPQQTGGLFGATTQNQPQGLGFLGQQAQNTPFGQQPQQSSLFGQTSQQPPQGSLFGQTSMQGGLFGGQTTQPAQQQPGIGFGGFGGQGQMGGLGGFGTQPTLGGVAIGTNYQANQQFGSMGLGVQVQPPMNTFNVKLDKNQAVVNADKNKQGQRSYVHSINFMPQLKGYTLIELRMQDYQLMKTNQTTPEVQQLLQRVMSGTITQTTQFGQQMPFGQQQQQTQPLGTGLFGQQQQQPQQAQTGLFGQQPMQQPQQSLFGGMGQQSSTPQTTGGLFGNLTQPTTQPTTSLLGGQTQPSLGLNFGTQPAQSTGLFGQTAQPAQKTGGLFGQPAQQTTGGLFGQTTQQPQQSTGLFGQQPTVTTTGSGSLFGQTQQQPQTGGLFGGLGSQPQTTTGGLFGQQPQTSTTSGGLFGAATTTGLQTTAAPTGGLFGNLQQPLQTQQPLFSQTQTQDVLQNTLQVGEFVPQKVDWSELSKEFFPKSYQTSPQIMSCQYKLLQPQKQEKDQLFFQSIQKQQQKKPNREEIIKPQKNDSRPQQEKQCDMKQFEQKRQSEQKPNQDKQIIESFFQSDVITFRIRPENNRQLDLVIKIPQETSVGQLKNEILQKLLKGDESVKPSNFRLLWIPRNQAPLILNEQNLIEDYSMLKEEELKLVSIDQQVRSQKQELVSEDLLPTLTNRGYSIQPTIAKLARMTEKELSKVPNFLIQNEFVKILFKEPVDLRQVDLDKTVRLSQLCVEMYPEEYFTDEGYRIFILEKPEVGQKLNVPASITFFNFKQKDGQDDQNKFMKKLLKWIKKNEMEFQSYDPEKEILVVNVKHF